jgi:hypothetical protein
MGRRLVDWSWIMGKSKKVRKGLAIIETLNKQKTYLILFQIQNKTWMTMEAEAVAIMEAVGCCHVLLLNSQ